MSIGTSTNLVLLHLLLAAIIAGRWLQGWLVNYF